jgi:hypothetical protein
VEAGELDGVLVQMSKTAVMMKGKRAAKSASQACKQKGGSV